MVPSKTVPVRLNEELQKELEYLLKIANEKHLLDITQSDIVRIAIKRLYADVRANGVLY